MASAQVHIISCDLCGTSKNVPWQCLQCEENMCAGCKDIHLKGKATRNHEIQRISSQGTLDTTELSCFTLLDPVTSDDNNIVSVTPVTQKTAWIGRERHNKLSLYSSDGNRLKWQPFTGWISSVTVSDIGEIIVTIPLKYSIDVFTPGDIIYTLATFNDLQPRGICFTKSGHIIVGVVDDYSMKTDSGSVRLIYKLNKKGNILETFGYSQTNPLFTIPRRIKENLNGDMIVVDKYKKNEACIIALDKSGNLRFKYTGQETENAQRKFDAVDVTFDPNGRLIVLNKAEKDIHILDQDGKFIQYLKTGINDKVPRCISLGFDRILWIGYEMNCAATFKYLL